MSDAPTRPGLPGGRAPRLATPAPDGDRYEIGDVIGSGGMGEVVTAHDRQLGRTVALKRLLAEAPTDDEVARFSREARIQGRLDHPAIAPVHELARDREGRLFFAMKQVGGKTMAELIETGDPRVTRPRLLRAYVDACLAIELAHRRGVIHRDLKPSNLMLGDYGEVYVIDWGVARFVDEPDPSTTPMGTVGYMAPEQLTCAPDLDGRADVYALGSILFEILTGKPLHPSADDAGVRSTLEGTDNRPSRRAPDRDIPPELDDLCVDATAIDRGARVASAQRLADRVQRYLDGDRDHARRRDLAREHLARATAAFATGDLDGRRAAMRDAGRALALDPTLAEAAHLVGRLMVEAPTTPPRGADDVLAASDRVAENRHMWVAMIGAIGFAMFLPAFFVVGVREPAYLVVLAVLIAVAAAIAGVGIARQRRTRSDGTSERRSRAVFWIFVALYGVMIMLVSRIVSPFLFAPGLAAVTMASVAMNPALRSRRAVLIAAAWMMLAVLLPYGAERAGLISSTVAIDESGITIRGGAVEHRQAVIETGFVFFVILLIVAAAAIAGVLTRAEQRARQRIQIQAWWLRQLYEPQ
jgi:serine/threonine-protein kinase